MNVRRHKFELYFLVALCFTAMFRICAFLITRLTDIGGYIDYAGSSWDRIINGVRKVHQSQLLSLLP